MGRSDRAETWNGSGREEEENSTREEFWGRVMSGGENRSDQGKMPVG